MVVHGLDGRLPRDSAVLDARLSGTTSRFLAPMLALGPGPYRLDGADPLRARPMGTGFEALQSIGAVVQAVDRPGHLPVDVGYGPAAAAPTEAAEVRLDAGISSQFVSGLLLSGPCRPGGLVVRLDGDIVSAPYLDMTVAVMEAFGAEVRHADVRTYLVAPTGYRPCRYRIEPDASAASYVFAAAAIAGGRVRVEGLGRTSLQGDLAFVDVLERMGWRSSGGAITPRCVPPARSAASAPTSRRSRTRPRPWPRWRSSPTAPARSPESASSGRKETDRLAAVVAELRRCGIDATETDDGFLVVPGRPQPAVIQTYDDHRMAMSFALLGLRAEGIAIADPGCVAKTFPDYWDTLDQLRNARTAGQ